MEGYEANDTSSLKAGLAKLRAVGLKAQLRKYPEIARALAGDGCRPKKQVAAADTGDTTEQPRLDAGQATEVPPVAVSQTQPSNK